MEDIFIRPSKIDRWTVAVWLYYLGYGYGDPISAVNLGWSVPVTFNQCAMVAGIGLFASALTTRGTMTATARLTVCLVATSVACTWVEFLHTLVRYQQYVWFAATITVNLLWLSLAIISIPSRFGFAEMFRLLKGFAVLSFGIWIAGGIEAVTQQPLFREGNMQSGLLAGLAWVRAFNIDKIDFVSVVSISLFFLIGYGIYSKKQLMRVVAIALAVGILTLISLSFSATGQIGVIIGISVLIVFRFFKKGMFPIIFLVFLVGLTAVWFKDTDIVVAQKAAYETKYLIQVEEQGISNFRVEGNLLMLRLAIKNPFGIGLGRSFEEMGEYVGNLKPISSHSMLSVLAEGGVLGFPAFFLILVTVKRWSTCAMRRRTEERLSEVVVSVTLSGVGAVYTTRLLVYFHTLDNSFFVLSIMLMSLWAQVEERAYMGSLNGSCKTARVSQRGATRR